jgi:DNA modification methylase
MNKIVNIDCLIGLKELETGSVDLVITSPPYKDISGVNYGKNVELKKVDFVDWFLDIMIEVKRVLKDSGSFILNINDFVKDGYKDLYVYELIYKSKDILKLYDTYIWNKKNPIPNGSPKRFRNSTEFIFHFCKNNKQMKFYMDRVLQEPKSATKSDDVEKKEKTFVLHRQNSVMVDGKRVSGYKIKEVPYLVRPTNVFQFSTCSGNRDNLIKHPAPYHKELPLFFIKALTDEGDLVVDPFSGIGTTGLACKELGRNYIGFELNKNYADFSNQRINEIDTK